MGRCVIFLCLVLCSLAAAQKSKNKKESKVDGKIVGGKFGNIDHFPYQVNLGSLEPVPGKRNLYQFINFCGGSIIDSYHILTAAHCIEPMPVPEKNLYVRAFFTKASSNEGDFVKVEEIYGHSKYDVNTTNNDIAILRLEHPLKEFSPAQYVNFTFRRPRLGDSLLLSGWGTTKMDAKEGSDTLKYTIVPYIEPGTCNELYSKHHQKITDKMICGGLPNGGTDSCQGDSGGPAIRLPKGKTGFRGDEQREQVGIVSWGIGCALPGIPGVYTDISQYRNWMTTVIAESSKAIKD